MTVPELRAWLADHQGVVARVAHTVDEGHVGAVYVMPTGSQTAVLTPAEAHRVYGDGWEAAVSGTAGTPVLLVSADGADVYAVLLDVVPLT